ncbi:MAG: ABC transporter substrate-binding protein [Pseudomonadota bacterium]
MQAILRYALSSSLFLLAFIALVSCGSESDSRATIAQAGSVWWNAPMFFANDYYSENGIEMVSFDVTTGLESKNAVVAGTADFGVVAATPLVNAALNGEDVLVLGAYMSSSELVGVVHAQDNEIDALERGPVAYTKGTISEFYARSLLASSSNYPSLDELTLITVTPPGIVGTLANGDARAAVGFDPFTHQALDRLQEDGFKLDVSPQKYTVYGFLITTSKYANEEPDVVTAVINSYKTASNFVTDRPAESIERLENQFSMLPGTLKPRFDTVDFNYVTDKQTIQEALNREFELAAEAGLTRGLLAEANNFDYMLTKLD